MTGKLSTKPSSAEVNQEEKNIDHGFTAILGDQPKILILGTLPSVKSLEEQQYYGHPRNAFWWIMSQLCGFDSALSYIERLELVKQNEIAIWDVIRTCHRPGSLDSSIDQSTLEPNDFSGLLATLPSIRTIVFNGQAANKLFKKHVDLAGWCGEFLTMPSTSPANAAMTKEMKLEKWSLLKAYL